MTTLDLEIEDSDVTASDAPTNILYGWAQVWMHQNIMSALNFREVFQICFDVR